MDAMRQPEALLDELQRLTEHLRTTILDGSFYRLSRRQRRTQIREIKKLCDRLREPVPMLRGQRSVVAAAGVLALLASCQPPTQPPDLDYVVSFGAPQADPFGTTRVAPYFSAPAVADMDNDGDLDLLMFNGDRDIFYFENTGSPAAPAFGAPATNPFGLDSAMMFVGSLAIGDMDNDDDLDIMAPGIGGIQFFRNDGTAAAPAFVDGGVNPFGLSPTFSLQYFPCITDVDGDGDPDMLIVRIDTDQAISEFHENTGTASAPAFAAPVASPFGLPILFGLANPAAGDIDKDGDIDLVYGEYTGDLIFVENIGTAGAPAFGPLQRNAHGMANVGMLSSAALGDLDDDGDLDLIVGNYHDYYVTGDYYAGIIYFENTSGYQ